MKKIIISVICFSAIFFSSCDDFLEEVSQDQVTPKTAEDYMQFLYGEVYKKANDGYYHTWLDLMTDDCKSFAKKSSLGSDTRIEGWGYYTWQKDPEVRMDGLVNSDNAWAHYYHNILMVNIVLYNADEVGGSDEERAQLKAECHMIRAYAYWMLVNLYGEPYDPDTAEKALGIPVNDLVGAEDKKFTRASVAEIYRLITSDIAQALEEFELSGGGKTIFRWNRNAANVFASRVALYMKNWDDAIKYASAALVAKPNLWNLEEKSAGSHSADVFFVKDNPEILFTYGSGQMTFFRSGVKGAFPASDDLGNAFSAGDLRYYNTNNQRQRGHFVKTQGSILIGGGSRVIPFKAETTLTDVCGSAIRNAEALLNRAEAYAHKTSDLQLALDDLNTLRRNRFTAATYNDLTFSDQQDLFEKVKQERRLELCFEQHRWFDLRRWGCPRIEHVFLINLGETVTETFVLEENDPAYTLPLPQSVQSAEPELKNIERPERTPVQ